MIRKAMTLIAIKVKYYVFKTHPNILNLIAWNCVH